MLLKNFSSGVLATAIGTGDTTINIVSGNSLPTASGIFTAIIWNSTLYSSPSQDPQAEIVLGQYSSTNTYTITRAQENTSAAPHSAGATVGLYITAGIFGMTKVSSGVLASVSSFSIPNLSPGIRYKLILNLSQNTSNGAQILTFNGDSGSNYTYQYLSSVSSSVIGGGESGTTFVSLYYTGVLASSYEQIEMLFQTVAGSNAEVIYNIHNNYIDSGSGKCILIVDGIYSGSSNLSSLMITTNAGTISGTWALYQLN